MEENELFQLLIQPFVVFFFFFCQTLELLLPWQEGDIF